METKAVVWLSMNGNSVIDGFTIQNGSGTLEGNTLYGGGHVNSNRLHE